MSDYIVTTNFGAKDSLPSGNAGKTIKGSEFTVEFNNIATAIASKVDNNQVLTNVPANAIFTANDFTDADHTKLDNIETSADVTDTANVVAALTAGTNITINNNGTISATDTNTNTTYTAGTGITLTNTEFSADGANINAGSVDGFHISTASSGTDANTIYFRT